MPLVTYRRYLPSDEDFVIGSWRRQLAAHGVGASSRGRIGQSVADLVRDEIVERVGESNTIVACGNDDADQIHGWMCSGLIGDIQIVHGIYVKHVYRGLGIATGLMRLVGINRRSDDVIARDAIITSPGSTLSVLSRKFGLTYCPHVALVKSAWESDGCTL